MKKVYYCTVHVIGEDRERKEGKREDSSKSILFDQQREQGNLTNCSNEEYTARYSRIKDGFKVSEQLAMVGEDLGYIYCSMMLMIMIMVILWVR